MPRSRLGSCLLLTASRSRCQLRTRRRRAPLRVRIWTPLLLWAPRRRSGEGRPASAVWCPCPHTKAAGCPAPVGCPGFGPPHGFSRGTASPGRSAACRRPPLTRPPPCAPAPGLSRAHLTYSACTRARCRSGRTGPCLSVVYNRLGAHGVPDPASENRPGRSPWPFAVTLLFS